MAVQMSCFARLLTLHAVICLRCNLYGCWLICTWAFLFSGITDQWKHIERNWHWHYRWFCRLQHPLHHWSHSHLCRQNSAPGLETFVKGHRLLCCSHSWHHLHLFRWEGALVCYQHPNSQQRPCCNNNSVNAVSICLSLYPSPVELCTQLT